MKSAINKIQEKHYINAKKRLLKMHFESKTGHLGSNLSCFDFLYVLYNFIITKGDTFILSKGHSAGALYSALWSVGLISEDDINSFCKDGSIFAAHPSSLKIPGVIFPTGSLGHGFSLASGVAYAEKLKNSNKKIYCLCSDGEWQEGACWEALIFSTSNDLSNLIVIIDENNLQGFGRTKEIVGYQSIKERIEQFGINVFSIDGHNLNQILNIPNLISADNYKPTVVILKTIKGKGMFSENEVRSHYLPLSEDEYNHLIHNL